MSGKFEYLHVVQGRYTEEYGWEDLTYSDNPKTASGDLKSYRDNEPHVPHRIIQRRVPRTEANHE